MTAAFNYTFDANILIGLHQRYPRDIFVGAWEAVEELVSDGRACICAAVLDEISRGGDDLHGWASSLTGLTCPVGRDEPLVAAEISAAHPDWVRGRQNEADPWLIAHAEVHGRRVIVSDERPAGHGVRDSNQKVPNVAAERGLRTIRFFDLARHEGWIFH